MVYNYIRLEFSICVLLILLLFVEYCVELWVDESIYNLNSNSSMVYQSVVLPTLFITNSSFKDDNEIHDRPLFNEDRKPKQLNPIALDASNTDSGALDSWILIGVFTNDNKTYALFKNKNENKKYLKLSENQTITGWLIKEIKPTHVLLELSGQERVLELISIRQKVKPSADYDPTLKR